MDDTMDDTMDEETKEQMEEKEETKEEDQPRLASDVEAQVGLPVPIIFNTYDRVTQDQLVQYLQQLTPIERKAYLIGHDHLGTSFHVLKSNGFNEWKKKQPK